MKEWIMEKFEKEKPQRKNHKGKTTKEKPQRKKTQRKKHKGKNTKEKTQRKKPQMKKPQRKIILRGFYYLCLFL